MLKDIADSKRITMHVHSDETYKSQSVRDKSHKCILHAEFHFMILHDLSSSFQLIPLIYTISGFPTLCIDIIGPVLALITR